MVDPAAVAYSRFSEEMLPSSNPTARMMSLQVQCSISCGTYNTLHIKQLPEQKDGSINISTVR